MQKKRRIIVVIVLAVSVLLALVVVTINSIINMNYQENDGAGQEINEKSAVFSNREVINAAIGPDSAAVILTNISNFIFSESEMETAEHSNSADFGNNNYYGVVINQDLMAYDPNYTFKFSIGVSDGREYAVSFRTDDEYGYRSYIMVAIRNLKNNNHEIIYLNANEIQDETGLINWMINFAGLNEGVKIINLPNPLIIN